MKTLKLIGFAFACQFTAALPAWSHDMWIEPSSWQPRANEQVSVELRIGDSAPGERVARSGSFVRFESKNNASSKDIRGVAGTAPAGFVVAEDVGVLALIYESDPTEISLPTDKFLSYLREEGLDSIASTIVQRDPQDSLGSEAPQHEIYSRSLKSLMPVEGQGTGYDVAAGLPIELVPVSNPFEMNSGPIVLQALKFGLPVEALFLTAVDLDGRAAPRSGRTDARGRIEFVLPPGRWLIAGVWMRPARPDENADWISLWTSLTFERR